MRAAIILAASLAFGGTAVAAERAHIPCASLKKIKAEADAKTHFTVLTPGQFHFAEGLWVGSPTTPAGMPPGNSAILVTHEGDKDGLIIWVRGPLACAPIPINEKLLKMVAAIKTGALDSDGDEL